MATTVGTLLFRIQADTQALTQGMQQAKSAIGKIQSAVKTFGTTLLAAFSVNAVKNFLVQSVEAYGEQEKAEAKLRTALKGREDITKSLVKYAVELQGMTIFGDEEAVNAMALLATFGLNEAAIRKLTPLIMDMSTALGMGLNEATIAVGKSIGSSTNSLKRYGIDITGTVGSSKRLSSAVESLTEMFEGQARAAAETAAGALTQMKNAFGEMKEEIGKLISPGLTSFSKEVTNMLTVINTADMSGLEKLVSLIFIASNPFAWAQVQKGLALKTPVAEGAMAMTVPAGTKTTKLPKIKSYPHQYISQSMISQKGDVEALLPWSAKTLWKWGEEYERMLERTTHLTRSFAIETGGIIIDLASTINQGIQSMLDTIASGIESAFAGDFGLKKFYNSIFIAIGRFMQQLGTSLVITGLGITALYASFENPAAAIAAGLALIVAGSALAGAARGGLKGIASGGSGFDYSGMYPSSGAGSLRTIKIETESVTKGSDIYQTQKRYDKFHSSVT